jgi:hypothetical protein
MTVINFSGVWTTVALAGFVRPFVSGLSLSPIPVALPSLAATETPSNLFSAFRGQLQRSELKRKLVAAAKDKDEELVLSLVDELSQFNPTECPTLGLAGYGSGSALEAPLNGSWRLLFTNAKDAEEPARTESDPSGQFGKSAATGVTVKTGQTIDASKGECVNFIALEGDSRPFDRLEITIQMTPLTETRVRLDFLRGVAFNANAPLPFLREFRFSFPPAVVGDILATIRGKDPKIEPQAYFDVVYIDDTMRVHKTGLGKVFVQERA